MAKTMDFKLVISGTEGAYTVAAEGPGGVNVDPVPFVFERTPEVEAQLNRIKSGFAPTRGMMQAVGTRLFNALFPRPILRPFDRAAGALGDGERLRLRIKTVPPALRGLPWELLYDPTEHKFLADRLSLPVVRFIESATPVSLPAFDPPLRVLYIASNPAGTNPLDLGQSEAAVREGLGVGPEIRSLRNVRPDALQNALREFRPHIVHYDGHGDFDETAGTGYLVFQGDGDAAQHLEAAVFASHLDGAAGLRLVVLAACESGAASHEKRFAGIADQLMRTTRLSAVAAMQYEIPDASARAFNQGFYGALADGFPVDAALVEGRKAINTRLAGTPFAQPDWATPVLYLKVADGALFESHPEGEQTMPEEKKTASGRMINTGGGNYYESPINVSHGDFVGGNKNVYGNEIRAENLSQVFQEFYQRIEARPADPVWDKGQIKNAVEQIEAEAKKGEDASEAKVGSWLQMLGNMAPDIFEVVAATLANPVKGVAAVIQKIAQKAKEGK